MTSLSHPLDHLHHRTTRTICGGLLLAMTMVLSGCSGSGGTDTSSAASGVGTSTSSIGVSSSSSSNATILGVETPSAISVVTATNAT
jgi:hypothetical protein